MRLFRCAFDECHLMSVQLPSDFVALRHIGAQQKFLCRPACPMQYSAVGSSMWVKHVHTWPAATPHCPSHCHYVEHVFCLAVRRKHWPAHRRGHLWL